MTLRKSDLQPAIRVAPPRRLNVYVVHKHQLDLLAQGSPSSLMLNFALFFLGAAVSALGTLLSAPRTDARVYYTFLNIFLISAIAWVVLISLWWSLHASTRTLVEQIKSQMPPNEGVREEPPDS